MWTHFDYLGKNGSLCVKKSATGSPVSRQTSRDTDITVRILFIPFFIAEFVIPQKPIGRSNRSSGSTAHHERIYSQPLRSVQRLAAVQSSRPKEFKVNFHVSRILETWNAC